MALSEIFDGWLDEWVSQIEEYDAFQGDDLDELETEADYVEGEPIRGTTTDMARRLANLAEADWRRAGLTPPGAISMEPNLPVGPTGIQAIPGTGTRQAAIDVSFPTLDGRSRVNVEVESRPKEIDGAITHHLTQMQLAQARHADLQPVQTTQSVYMQTQPSDPAKITRIFRGTYTTDASGNVTQQVTQIYPRPSPGALATVTGPVRNIPAGRPISAARAYVLVRRSLGPAMQAPASAQALSRGRGRQRTSSAQGQGAQRAAGPRAQAARTQSNMRRRARGPRSFDAFFAEDI